MPQIAEFCDRPSPGYPDILTPRAIASDGGHSTCLAPEIAEISVKVVYDEETPEFIAG
jgi:hypothetical protein